MFRSRPDGVSDASPNPQAIEDRPVQQGVTGQKPETNHSLSKGERRYDFEKLYPVGNQVNDDLNYYPGALPDKEYNRLQARLRKGKVKLCPKCGGVMNRSSRMILSPWGGMGLIVLGAILMAGYGLATNFYQTPWFVKFALPAGYYIGAIFVGVGILFFFLREKVWFCKSCREMDKR